MASHTPDSDIGVLVVHGIGAQKPHETLRKLLAGLRRVDSTAVPAAADNGARGVVGGQGVRFYEVYWADLMSGELAAGAFRMSELQSIAWFPLLNVCRGNYRAGSYGFARLAWWCLVLPIVNVLVLLAYHGTGLLTELFAQVRDSGERRPAEADATFAQRVRKASERTTKDLRFGRLLDEYVGDVFSYVNSAGSAFYREADEPRVRPEVQDVYARVMRRFYEQLTRAADECGSIQIVAHSLGTVVTFHALAGLRLESDHTAEPERVRTAIAKVEHLYTIGSPLEKIRFLWPRLANGEAFLTLTHVRWDNFVSWFDPVAGMLKRFEHWGEVCNHRLLGGGFISGHIVYERSALFLETFTRGLCGRALELQVGRGERMRDYAMLAGETLLAPALLALAVLAGAMILAMTAALVPWLVSLPLRFFLEPETWSPWIDAATLFFGAMMAIALLIAPIVRARRVHALYWAPQMHRPRVWNNKGDAR